jgi:hypothetical protein
MISVRILVFGVISPTGRDRDRGSATTLWPLSLMTLSHFNVGRRTMTIYFPRSPCPALSLPARSYYYYYYHHHHHRYCCRRHTRYNRAHVAHLHVKVDIVIIPRTPAKRCTWRRPECVGGGAATVFNQRRRDATAKGYRCTGTPLGWSLRSTLRAHCFPNKQSTVVLVFNRDDRAWAQVTGRAMNAPRTVVCFRIGIRIARTVSRTLA